MLAKLLDLFFLQTAPEQTTRKPKRDADVAKDFTTRKIPLSVPETNISWRFDWYVKGRGLPPVIADFLDTHWRSYALRCLLRDGHDSESYRAAVKAMKELAWSVRPQQHALSRRRLVDLIPQLYQQLHVGLVTLGLGQGTAEHNVFFGELAKLHQAALNPRTPVTEAASADNTKALPCRGSCAPRRLWP